MKVMMLWRYYDGYLKWFYERHPEAVDMPYKEHKRLMLDNRYSWSVSLSRYMASIGIEACFIVVNDKYLQEKWARENRLSLRRKGREKQIVYAQVKEFKPNILWISALFDYYGDFIKEVSSYAGKIITWVGSPFFDNIDVSGISVLLTENPMTLKNVQNMFDKVIVTKPGFDEKVIDHIKGVEKTRAITFVGSITPLHTKRINLIYYLIKRGVRLEVFGNISGFSRLDKCLNFIRKDKNLNKYEILKKDWLKTLKKYHYGPVFDIDMFKILASSNITLNCHIDMAGDNSGNMRLFEATGCGTCMVTESSKNIKDIFSEDEIVIYDSKYDLLSIIGDLLDNPDKVEKISHNAQRKTLGDYSIKSMFSRIEKAFY